jgi:hypothetical protein
MLRELFLKQWASAECADVCGMKKRRMVLLVERFYPTCMEAHEEEVIPSCGEYYMNAYEDHFCYEEFQTFKPFDNSLIREFSNQSCT